MTFLIEPDGSPELQIEVRSSSEIAWITLQGEADISTLESLESALRQAELQDVTSLHLHVKKLDFVDSTTVRRLTVFARRARRSGHHIKTFGASPTFRMLARLLGARDVLGLP